MAVKLNSKQIGNKLQRLARMPDLNSLKTHKKAARIDDLLLGHNHVEGSGLNRSSVVFDYSSKRAQKGAQRVARPPRVQRFSNGMVLIERDNETPEFISGELFAAQYGKTGVN